MDQLCSRAIFSDVVIFLRKLKDDNIKSVSGKKLIKKQKLIIPQICLNLHLFLDSNQIIRVYTSVQNCPGLKYDQINPILLPREHKFTELIIKEAHIKARKIIITWLKTRGALDSLTEVISELTRELLTRSNLVC